jgi:hypothetical protein
MKILFSILCLFVSGALADQAPRKEVDNGQTKQTHSFETLLSVVLEDVCRNEKLDSQRAFYGTKGDASIVLCNSVWSLPWLERFKPKVSGWEILCDDQFESPQWIALDGSGSGDTSKTDRKLGLRWRSIAQQGDAGCYEVVLTLFNVGGDRNGAVKGGTTLQYKVQFDFKNKKWSVLAVECSSSL